MATPDDDPAPPAPPPRRASPRSEARKARLEQQLRANLVRRKDRARSRPTAAAPDGDEA